MPGNDDVSTTVSPAFALPERLAAKAEPALTGADEQHFTAIRTSLTQQVDDLSDRLDVLRAAPGRAGQQALDRDLEVHRLTSRLRILRRFGLDVCLGRMVYADGSEPVYVGRLGLTDRAGRQLLVDWRTPAAEPFFAATHAAPSRLASRRRYRWTQGRVSDYWDEVFLPDDLLGHAALDDQSAFIASLGASRTTRMRDVLTTIAGDQDAIIRASSRGVLVVDGGPGTGKTVAALHRAAYLLYSDPRLDHRRGGVLVVGPHRPYLAYIADVLPSLGEEGVQTCTVRDLVAEGASAAAETNPEVARLKSSADMVRAVEPAVGLYEEPPTERLTIATDWFDVKIRPADWAKAFGAPDPVTPHNLAREQVWQALLAIVADDHADELDDADVSADLLGWVLRQDEDLMDTLGRAWTLIDALDLVGDLWSVPAYLRRCAPWLTPDQVRLLQRQNAQAWTTSDLPLLDAARQRLGHPDEARLQRRRKAAAAAERAYMDRVVDDLIAADDDGEGLVTALRQTRLRDQLVDEAALPSSDPDQLAGPFAHIVVDEAQELTDAEWQMLLRRCPSRGFTIVGDRAQARHGFSESWPKRLERVGFEDVRVALLTINYRTPEEVMAEAEPVIRTAVPDANVPTSVRRNGVPVVHGPTSTLDSVLDTWLSTHDDGIACVIHADGVETGLARAARVRYLTPATSKGLEFDLVVLVDPDRFGKGVEGAVDRYVAMTRATQQLVILNSYA